MDRPWGSARPIQTHYAGHHFRSRLEARWAIFFDTLGERWDYEPEGFDLDGVWYLPDFWLPDLGWWAEVKPEFGYEYRHLRDDAVDKVVALAAHTQKPVVLLEGIFDARDVDNAGGYPIGAPIGDGEAVFDLGCQWAACLECEHVGIADGGMRTFLGCGHHALGTNKLLADAYVAARTARSERGGR